MARIAWYFDFVSPFAYLQFAAHPDLVRRDDVERVPCLFAGMLQHWGHKGPAELTGKRVHTYRHTTWLASQLGVPFRYPSGHPFNPIPVLRLAIALGSSYAVIRQIFDFIWAEGHLPNDEWRTLTDRLGVADPDAVVNAPEVKAKLRENGERAIAAGVFGVPTFAVDGHLFWGLDATGMLRDYLADPTLFDSDEMRRVSTLPVSAARKGS
jgi:2-hydroxychromene-2-carboxylate isomerase